MLTMSGCCAGRVCRVFGKLEIVASRFLVLAQWRWTKVPRVFCFRPQAPGASHARRLARRISGGARPNSLARAGSPAARGLRVLADLRQGSWCWPAKFHQVSSDSLRFARPSGRASSVLIPSTKKIWAAGHLRARALSLWRACGASRRAPRFWFCAAHPRRDFLAPPALRAASRPCGRCATELRHQASRTALGPSQ